MENWDDYDREKEEDQGRISSRGDEIMKKISKNIGSGTIGKGWTTKENLKDRLGICCDCSLLDFTRSEFGRVFAKCSKKKMRLEGKDRIVECTSYWQKGQMDLYEMYDIATLIEISKIEIKGFTSK